MEAIGALNLQGNTVLQTPSRYIRVLHQGEWYMARRYLGDTFSYSSGVVQSGDYIGIAPEGYLLHCNPAWLVQNPTRWAKV